MHTDSSRRTLRDDAPAQAQFIEPTPASRRKILVIALVAVVAGLACKLWLFPAYFGYIDRLPLCDRIPWLRDSILFVSLIPLAVAAGWAVPTARKLLRIGQSPLPGTLVFVRTPIKRGRVVRWRAYGLFAWSAFALFVAIWGWHVVVQKPLFSPPATCRPGAVHAAHPPTAGNAPTSVPP